MPYNAKIHELQDPDFRRAQMERRIRNAFVVAFIEGLLEDVPEAVGFLELDLWIYLEIR